MDAMDRALAEIKAAYVAARAKHPPLHSHHEGYGVIREEIDEYWDAVKRDQNQSARREIAQVGAMAIAIMLECPDSPAPPLRSRNPSTGQSA